MGAAFLVSRRRCVTLCFTKNCSTEVAYFSNFSLYGHGSSVVPISQVGAILRERKIKRYSDSCVL